MIAGSDFGRLEAYERQTRPVADYYRVQRRLVAVNADRTVEEVTAQIFGVIDSHTSGQHKREQEPKRSESPECNMSFGEDRIIRKSPEEIEKMRRSGKMVRQVLNHLKAMVAPGVTTMDLEKAAEKLIAELGARRRSRDITVIPACSALRSMKRSCTAFRRKSGR
jgi:hypothetical protein